MTRDQLIQEAASFWEFAKEFFRPYNPLAIEIVVLWIVSSSVLNLVRFIS